MRKNFFRKLLAVLLTLCLCTGMTPAFASGRTILNNVDTVMIYNPLLQENSVLSTGSMLGQIKTESGNFLYAEPDPVVEEEGFYFADQSVFLEELAGMKPEPELETNELTKPQAAYTVGSVRSFHYDPYSSYTGASAEFTCLYSGTRCLIWGYGYSNTDIAQAMGRTFDEQIYAADVNNFGSARYVKDGAKLNILIYTMYQSGLLGYFRTIELHTAAEMGSANAKYYNNGEAIIHVNATACTAAKYQSVGLVTLVHEFQHLICYSSTIFGNGSENDTIGLWLNEAMSMQAEELCFPGEVVKEGYVSGCYNGSGDIAAGQSLYDFSTTNDIGVYGQGFLFSEYLKAQYGGKNVFREIHSYWRTAEKARLTDADVLASVMSGIGPALNSNISYPASLQKQFGSSSELMLSKLNLAFQIATVLKQSSGIYSLTSGCQESDPRLYTGTSCSIEGGGRIYVKTADGNTYTVPTGADSRLIYVGFKDGRMTIAPTTAEEYVYVSPYRITATSSDSRLGSVSVKGNVITAIPAAGCGYAYPPCTVVSGSATVYLEGNIFTVYADSDCTIRINFEEKNAGTDIWDGSVAASIPRSGTDFLISTGAELARFCLLVNDGDVTASRANVRLCVDIDLNNIGWMPIGTSGSRYFAGTFDGGGHTISGLSMGTPSSPRTDDFIGLFGITGGATIKNLTIRNARVYGTNYAGLLAGYMSGGAVYDCHVEGSLSGQIHLGMISGDSTNGTFERCSSSGTIACGNYRAGGILGSGMNVTVSQCRSDISITGAESVSCFGGIVGQSCGSGISNCYSRSELTGKYYVGGIVGYNNDADIRTAVTDCYWEGKIDAVGSYGAIVGGCDTEPRCSGCYFASGDYAADGRSSYSGITRVASSDALKVRSTYAGWDFSSVWSIDAGANDGYPHFIWETFPVAEVRIDSSRDYVFVGERMKLGLRLLPEIAEDVRYTVVSSEPTVLSVSQDGTVTGLKTGVSTVTLTSVSTGLSASREIAVLTENAVSAGFAGGSGTENDPYIVENPGNLLHLAQITNYGYSFAGEYIVQYCDIQLGGSASNPWTPIGTEERPFCGSYYGGCNALSGIYSVSAYLNGMFGYVYCGEVACLTISDSTISGGLNVGGFAGFAVGSNFLDCNTENTVTLSGGSETMDIGGIVGFVRDPDGDEPSTVGFCSNAATITGSGKDLVGVGGIVGVAESQTETAASVVACYNTGSITGSGTSTCAGGIVGVANNMEIVEVYNSGVVKGSGYIGGITGYLNENCLLMAAYNSGKVSNTTSYAGGITGIAVENSTICETYNWGSVSAYSSAHGIAGGNWGTILDSYCYSGTASDPYAATRYASQLRSQTSASMPGFDFDRVWMYQSGENNAFPVLKVFHPSCASGKLVFDKAAFSENRKDLVVRFVTNDNVLERLRGVDMAFMDNDKIGPNGTSELTVGMDYLLTLAPGVYTLSAQFGAHCFADFAVTVVDTTPGVFLCRPMEADIQGETMEVTLRISAPEECSVLLVMGVYSDERMESCTMQPLNVVFGCNEVTQELPYSAEREYKSFLLDDETFLPLTEDYGFTVVPDDEVDALRTESVVSGFLQQARLLLQQARQRV